MEVIEFEPERYQYPIGERSLDRTLPARIRVRHRCHGVRPVIATAKQSTHAAHVRELLPGILGTSQRLIVIPECGLRPSPENANSHIAVFPMHTMPARVP